MTVENSKLTVLVVDDEPLARDSIKHLLSSDRDVETVIEAPNGLEAVDRIRNAEIDLVILDVQMPGKSGLDVVREVGVEEMPVVVFATAYDQYAVDAFEAHALDYLLKPYDDERFYRAMERAKSVLRDRETAELGRRLSAMIENEEGGTSDAHDEEQERLALKTPGRMIYVHPAEIDYVEAADYCIRVHVGERVHVMRESMNRMENQLDPHQFVRIHRSTIVNVSRIREVQPLYHGDFVVILNDGSQHRLSRSRRKALEERLGRII